MEPQPAELLGDLLRNVSRSFYLTLRILPRAVRPQIGLAYLLARASDTIADTDAVAVEKRLQVLHEFRRQVMVAQGAHLELQGLAGQQSSPSERLLLERLDQALALLGSFEAADQERIRTVLGNIISGQTLDVERFAGADPSHPKALAQDEELDDYTYRVAGCVGEFWTSICRAHLFPHATLDDPTLMANAVRFGKGLQLVNILRDLAGDLRLGRCYLPEKRLNQLGLRPGDLLEPSRESQLRPLYNSYLRLAEEHLGAGWRYTNTLPFRCWRVRLACAWPVLIGIKTLQRLRHAPVLNPETRIKISRRDVRWLMIQSILVYPWPGQWRMLWDHAAGARGNTLPQPDVLVK